MFPMLMLKSSFTKVLPALMLAAVIGCSLEPYAVNPTPDEPKESPIPLVKEEVPESETEEIPESEQQGFMRITGDLRWDQLTSKEEWMQRFPDCLTDKYPVSYGLSFVRPSFSHLAVHKASLSDQYHVDNDKGFRMVTKYCKDFKVGGIAITPNDVSFAQNSGTQSEMMTEKVKFSFFDDSQNRAFKAALAEKYDCTADGCCSQYTCWALGDVYETGSITATPTPYTVSLLDNVNIDTSEL